MDERKKATALIVVAVLCLVLVGLVMCSQIKIIVTPTLSPSSPSTAATSSASSSLLSGWGAIVKRTTSSARIAVQFGNISQMVHTINLPRILLKDTEGFTYSNKEGLIAELSVSLISLIPGEVWRYELEFDIPLSKQPEVLIVPLDFFERSTARIPVLQSPGPIATQRIGYLLPSHSAELAGIVWSLESIRLDEGRGLLSLVLVVRNPGSKEINLSDLYVWVPHVADSTGRLAGIAGGHEFGRWPQAPSKVKAGEVFRIPLSFNVSGFQKPVYLFMRSGLPWSESKVVWRVVDGGF